ncbi:MAG: sugar-binding protein [Planctomycetia bacterium]|nr:sugar-binding protein [Planctomycetia bacterium]
MSLKNVGVMLVLLAGWSLGLWAEDAPKKKTFSCDWCTIAYPEKAIPEQKFEVQVTPTCDVPEGMKIGGDLHHATAKTYLGFAAWGGTPKPAKKGQTLTFTYKMPTYKTDEQGAQPIFFLTSKGWDEATKKAYPPTVLPLLTDEVRRTFRPKTATLKKSWLCCGEPVVSEWKSGEKVVIPVEYYVDPSDDWGKTRIVLWIVGPWVDCPDGKYTKTRTHHNYACGVPDIVCEIGKRVRTKWEFTLPKAYAEAAPEKGKFGDSLLLIAQFKGADNKFWPWQVRMGLPTFSRNGGFFDLDAPTPGNLFTYDQKVVLQVLPTEKGKQLKPANMTWQVSNTEGKIVASGNVRFPASQGKGVEIPLKLDEKGTFLLRAELPGKEAREITFARIPNNAAILGNGATRFGGQKFAGDEESAQAARLLGMSMVRVWVNWQNLEPARGKYNEAAWKMLRRDVDVLRRNHLRPWFMLDGFPAWAITHPNKYGGQFTALPVRDKDIQRIVTRLAQEFRNDILGFEWQNEIVPGDSCADPVAEYVRICLAANAASKKVNPNFRNQLAGGLWPQTFRQSLLAAGIADAVDILPIHYGNATAVRGAQHDLAAVGADTRIAVWDNETAHGISTWGMPLAEAIKDKSQTDYYFDRLSDELLAGCEQIVLFGGEASPAGDWSHFWGDHSPRPSAAALAVLIHALGDATPIGEFSVGKNDSIKLFERPNRPMVMVVSTLAKPGETVRLPVGNANVAKIDPQGNVTPIPHQGVVELPLTSSPYLVEGGDPDPLKAHLVLSFPGSASRIPTFTVAAGQTLEIPLRLDNLLSQPLEATLTLDDQKITLPPLAPGETRSQFLKLTNLPTGTQTKTLTLQFSDPKLPALTRKLLVRAVAAHEIGNLIQNPGFEEPAPQPDTAAHWNGTGKFGKRVPFSNPDEPGHGKYVCRFEKTQGQYFNIFQNVPQIPNESGDYVYSFWIRSENLATGSNFGGSTRDGKSWNRHWLQVFQSPKTQAEWQVFTKRLEIPNGTQTLTAAPVCQGDGWSLIDNVQLTPYEGTLFTAFAPKAEKITIDGNLDDFRRDAPIPLLGRNQLHTLQKNYTWSPQNCSAAAWFNYDETYLYVAVEVVDDRHVATHTEAACRQDDSLRLALHPLNRLPGEENRAFCFDISSTPPGGSGKHTLYRPKETSGGLKSGSLAKDSSIYDLVVHREGNRTIYELAMPWSDLGGPSGRVGTKIGLSLQLTDNDGSGPAALLLWGDGLYPAWSPRTFGMLTLTQ